MRVTAETQKDRLGNIRAWIRRRREKGQALSNKEIWERIQHRWPNLSAAQQQELFNRSTGTSSGNKHATRRT